MKFSYQANNLKKQFGGKSGVSSASFHVQEGTIHGIIGKNGAGKSVLMKMVSGIMVPSAGQLTIGGREVENSSWSPAAALSEGVAFIPQDPPKLTYLTVEDYLSLGNKGFSKLGIIDRKGIARKISEINEKLAIEVRSDDLVNYLPVEVQQLLAFGKGIFLNDAKIILLDEITASLSETRRLALLEQLRETVDGRSYTLITHHINEVIAACDRVTVIRDGQTVKTLDVKNTNKNELAELIVGEQLQEQFKKKNKKRLGTEVLNVSNLKSFNSFNSVNFRLAKHEVLGLAGLEGSGKHEVVEALVGLRNSEGMITVSGKEYFPRSPRSARKSGIAILPKNRERQATISSLSVFDNLLLPIATQFQNLFGLLAMKRMAATASDVVKNMRVHPADENAPIDSLSGGNRQKVMMGRLRLINPEIYLLNEPTRGVDISTKPVLLDLIKHDLVEDSAVIMTSESEEELIIACDRILIFFKGEIVRELKKNDASFDVNEIYKCSQGIGVPA